MDDEVDEPPVEVDVDDPPVEVEEPPVDVEVDEPPVEVEEPPVDVEPPLELEVDEITIPLDPLPPEPPKKPPAKNPPPKPPPQPPTTGVIGAAAVWIDGAGGSGTGTGAACEATVTTAGGHTGVVVVTTLRTTRLGAGRLPIRFGATFVNFVKELRAFCVSAT